jgi:hypothetical protein
MLEGVAVECLTIMHMGAFEIRDGNKSLIAWDERIPFASMPKDAVRLLEAQARPWSISKNSPWSVDDEDQADSWVADPRWGELQRAAHRFPVVQAVAALEIVGDTSDERIERLFGGQEHGSPELWLVLQALIVSKDPRAVRLALRVGRSYWPDLWDDAFQFLATVRAQEIEDFFIDFLVRDEGQHPWLERIADGYLAESAPRPPST